MAQFMGPTSQFGKMMQAIGWNLGPSETEAYVGGILLSVGIVYVFGLMVEVGLKNRWEAFVDNLLTRLPVVRTIYDSAKKIVQLIEPKQNSDMQSMTPVMCSFGAEGGTSFPAFLTNAELIKIDDIEYHVVMIPTAPVPFGGAIMCVRKEWIKPLDCGVMDCKYVHVDGEYGTRLCE